MARVLITPIKTSAGSTSPTHWKTSDYGAKVTTNGAYIACGGSSRIDPSRLLILVYKNSSYGTTGYLSVVSGSTNGKSDYFPGAYSTGNNKDIAIEKSGTARGGAAGGVSGFVSCQYISVADMAKYLDTDDYLKFNFSSALSSGTTAGKTTQGARISALYLKNGGH